MRIAAKLSGWLVAPFYLMVGVIFGLIVHRAGVLVSLGLLAGFLLVVLLWFYPIIGILAVIGGTCFIPFGSALPLTNVGSINIPDLILYLLISIVISRTLVLGDVRLIRTPLDAPLIIFVLVGITSLVVGRLLHLYDFFQAMREFKVILYYLVPIIVVNLIRDTKTLKYLIYACLLIGVISASQSVLSAWINPPTSLDDPMEVFYRYKDISGLGLLPYWTLIVLISAILVTKLRPWYIAGAAIPFSSLILGFSRHLWLGFLFSLLSVSVFVFERYKVKLVKLLSVGLFLFFLLVGAFLLRIEPLPTYLKLVALRADSLSLYEKDGNWQIRNVENKYAIENILSHPIWGIGFQRPYRPQIYGPKDDIEWFIHNGYLWILLKMGILGLIPFVWFSYVFIKRGVKYWNRVEDKFLKGIVLGSVCAYLGIALGNIAAPHFMQNWQVAVFGLSFGINEVIYRIEEVETPSRILP